eukprot:UN00923
MPLPASILNQKLGDLKRPTHIVSLDPFMKVSAAIEHLINSGVTGCPVRSPDSPVSGPDVNAASNFVGMISILDFVSFFVNIFNKCAQDAAGTTTTSPTKNKNAIAAAQVDFWDPQKNEEEFEFTIHLAAKKFKEATIADVITDPSIFLRYTQVSTETTIQDGLLQLGPGKNQRLLIVDDDNHIVNIVTQTSMLIYITNQISTSPELFAESKTLLQMELNSVLVDRVNPEQPSTKMKVPLLDREGSILSVKHDQLAIEAFQMMHKFKITGIAVTHRATGQLLGNISCRDIVSLIASGNKFELFSRSAFEYLTLIQQERVKKGAKLNAQRQAEEEARQAEVQGKSEFAIDNTTAELAVKPKLPPPTPANTIFENVYSMISSHSTLPQVLTISACDTVGYLMFLLAKHRVRRVYLTSGQLMTQGRTVHVPYSIVTLSDLMDLFGGNASTLNW